MFVRKQLFNGLGKESAFLWGVRQAGKSTLLKKLYPDSLYFDLLKADEFNRFVTNPSLLREIVSASEIRKPVIVDEIQLIPALLNEIQWLITNLNTRFILCGSSPRKILRSGANLLGGRALRYELYPLVSDEVPGFDLIKALNNGLIPRHYLSQDPKKLLSAYTGNYLRDEIQAEARIRNIHSFSHFLEVAAFSNGEMVNFSNIAGECGISPPTVREYFQILEDTMTGRFLPSFKKRPKRRVILAPKFYYFDPGIAGFLLKRGKILPGSESFGKAFEHFIYHEIYSYSHYSGLNYPISYWRTASKIEVDFILGDNEVALEVKGTSMVIPRNLKGLKCFSEEYKTKKSIIISTDPYPRLIDNILVLPWKDFLMRLWAGEIIQ